MQPLPARPVRRTLSPSNTVSAPRRRFFQERYRMRHDSLLAGALLLGLTCSAAAQQRAVGAPTSPQTASLGALQPGSGPNRFLLFVFANPVAGREAQFSELSDQRIRDVMTQPGWVAGQRFRNLDTSGKSSLRRFVSIYDVEAESAKAAYDTLSQGVSAGKVRQNNT